MSELIHHFGIDWRLLLAQAINFFVLLFLLRKFAYGPLIQMLRKRREDIEKGVAFTKKAESELKQVEEIRVETLRKTHQEALAIVTQADEEGKKRKEELLQEAHKKVEGVVLDAKKLIEEEKLKMKTSVLQSSEGLIRSAVTKVLGKLPAEERDRHLIQEALKELKSTQ